MPTPLLEMIGITKSFGGVQALKGVDFALQAGEIHGLVGENGAGKSTMMKIIAGVHSGYGGRMTIEGREVNFRSARDALAAGIGMVHQELSIVPDLSVAENVFLGKQPIGAVGQVRWSTMVREAGEQLRKLGLDVDPRTRIGSLPIGLQQLIELARVLFSGARIIILDEPTSALSPPEVEQLFSVLRALKREGRSTIFISHFLDDILRVSDAVTVFRNGRKVADSAVSTIDKGWVIEQMIGVGHDDLEESYTGAIPLAAKPSAPVVMAARNLGASRFFRDVSFDIRAGEILGIYGFMGCGQVELARTLFGKIAPDHGTLVLEGTPRRLRNTAAAKGAGIAFVPESRRSMLFHHEPVYKNASIAILDRISRLWLKPMREREITQVQIGALNIRPPRADALLGSLSGGNQQKVALAKWLTHPPKVLVLSEPTRGMDVGAKDDVVRIVRSLRDQGLAVVVVSTEPETVLSLADRILVMKKGAIAREFADGSISKDRLLEAA
ncbi:sugar ABC transporter ATP-binding protein [Lichenifustis flavocetrariae]|uniref:Sugar ABC transporter ATP-binding protein n=1 Tax=Lichenifustis flavocetrariae TaxID=2949735 RepID=A0AA41Z0F1_9HYPH|nr:sugar ABC transporter ATP-binding protein [Lichenifustis flavocetrariae]MCW6508170.1 sugar ABC transporter ATP-binding protein [Lichenifustis flavocetrariae]